VHFSVFTHNTSGHTVQNKAQHLPVLHKIC